MLTFFLVLLAFSIGYGMGAGKANDEWIASLYKETYEKYRHGTV